MSFETSLVLSTAVISFILAVFIFSRGTNKVLNQTLALFCLAIGVWTLGQALGAMAAHKDLVLLFTRINVGAAVMVPAFYLHFVFSLLNLNEKHRKILYSVYTAAAIFIISSFTPFFVKDVAPVFGLKYYPQAGWVYPFFTLYVVLVFMSGIGTLLLGVKNAAGEQYKKLVYVFSASLIGFLGSLTLFLPVFHVNFPILNPVLLPIVLIIMVYAIVRHQLLDITFIINQSLVYSALTFLFASFYVIAVVVANAYFSDFLRSAPLLTPILVVFVSVMVFQPVKNRVQNGVDKLFFRGEYYYLKTINDLSEENQKLFRYLLRADKLAALGTMAAGMAHEIRNPLAAMKGMAQVLPANLNDEEFMRDYIDIVPRQIDRINRIVENLLKAGKTTKLEAVQVDVNAIINEVLDFHAKLLQKQAINIDRQLSGRLLAYADPDQLQQVLANLVLNAVQAMPGGGNLTIISWQEGERAGVKVIDTGVGIPADKLEKIFDPFFTMKEEGTGLGLFVAYRIMQEHGGTIEATSQLGKGCEFTLWLPIKQQRSH
ncbi:MAG: ATP-binding protein [Candidatus Margulisbacteria bacterium]|nr:ATP-binding protein [Candidatus Margulisiibacteriota bacterium]